MDTVTQPTSKNQRTRRCVPVPSWLRTRETDAWFRGELGENGLRNRNPISIRSGATLLLAKFKRCQHCLIPSYSLKPSLKPKFYSGDCPGCPDCSREGRDWARPKETVSEDTMSEETRARIEERLRRARDLKFRRMVRQKMWEARFRELHSAYSGDNRRSVTANLSLVPGEDGGTTQVEVSQPLHHPLPHKPPMMLRYLYLRAPSRNFTVSAMAAEAISKKRQAELGERPHMLKVLRMRARAGDRKVVAATIDALLQELKFHKSTGVWRKLAEYIYQCGERRGDISPRDIFMEALLEILERFEKHILDGAKEYWKSDEGTAKKIYRAISGLANEPWTGEAWRISEKDLSPLGNGLGPANLRRARDDGVHPPLRIIPFVEEFGASSPGGGYRQPTGRVESSDGNAYVGIHETRKKAGRLFAKLRREHQDLLYRQHRVEEKLGARGAYEVKSTKALPRDKKKIREELLGFWREPVGRNVTPSRHPSGFDPYLSSETLRTWDREEERRKRHALEFLSVQQLKVVRMYYDGFDDETIAQLLGIAEKTVRSHRSTALKKIQEKVWYERAEIIRGEVEFLKSLGRLNKIGGFRAS